MQTLSRLLVICFVTLNFTVLAQHDVSEESLLQVIGAAKGPEISSSRVSTVQIGNDNEIFVQQINFAAANSVDAYQVGYVNSITVHQEGYNYSVRINQYGQSNRYFADIEGFDSILEVIQFGNENSIEQKSTLTDAGLTIIQIGNGHELIQTRDISHAQGIRIMQRGNGAKAIIR